MTAPIANALFAVTAPGLESITLGELNRLGLKGKAEIGGVSFRGGAEAAYSANLWLRSASRIVVRVARFHASAFHELERRAKQVTWGNYLTAGSTVRLNVTCRKSRLYHSDAVAERVLGAIARVAPGVALEGARSFDDSDDEVRGDPLPETNAQLFIVRIVDDECEISADTSGELLHRRGYRQETGKAPLRETLAAAMLLASGWRAGEALIDPLCGSGTIPIEAALLARGVAPGIRRRFAFMDWATFDASLWNKLHESAQTAARATGPMLEISGADRDSGAVESAERNAERAGVGQDVHFSKSPLSATLETLAAASHPGWVLTNPPYGVRVGDPEGLRDLYAALGSKVRSATGWRVGILTSDTALARQIGVPMRARFSTSNGGIPVAFLAQEKSPGGTVPLRNRGVKHKTDGN
ncbi:MAG: class I SAM-dependent RNA methyltransferase [Gemmatimonadota bacterium]|nr:class I SAM-dependent RNA methyltransferase [Gemmatimonadota bacterium]